MVLPWIGCDGSFEGIISNEVTVSLCKMLHACLGELVLDVFEEKAPLAVGADWTYRTCDAPVANEIHILALMLNCSIHAGPASDMS
jgi:hypothetical protein